MFHRSQCPVRQIFTTVLEYLILPSLKQKILWGKSKAYCGHNIILYIVIHNLFQVLILSLSTVSTSQLVPQSDTSYPQIRSSILVHWLCICITVQYFFLCLFLFLHNTALYLPLYLPLRACAGRQTMTELQPPEEFPFPFQPYDIQKQFMRGLYSALERGYIGIFESPTGTVRT